MKLGSIGYVPPHGIGYADAFLKNLSKFKTSYPVLLYTARQDIPGAVKVFSPDSLKDATFPNGQRNKYAINNACFLTGMRIAAAHNFTHVIYLEEDCRVGRDNWDAVIFDEFFDLGRPCIAAGTLVAHNPCTFSPLAARRWHELVSGNPKKNYPVATYGWVGADGPKTPTCLFPNGALGVYHVPWIGRLLDLSNTIKIASESTAWDMQVGLAVWKQWEEDAYEVLGFLRSVYSGYGNIVTTQEDRQKMLTAGACVGVHQIKSDWSG